MFIEFFIEILSITVTQRNTHIKINNPLHFCSDTIIKYSPNIFFGIIYKRQYRAKPHNSRYTVITQYFKCTKSLICSFNIRSTMRHKSSSYVVSVICTTHFDFSFIFFNKSRSRRTFVDFVIIVTPKPYLSITSRHFRILPSFSSIGIYGSDIAPVPIIHLFLFLLSAFSNNSTALALTSISSIYASSDSTNFLNHNKYTHANNLCIYSFRFSPIKSL